MSPALLRPVLAAAALGVTGVFVGAATADPYTTVIASCAAVVFGGAALVALTVDHIRRARVGLARMRDAVRDTDTGHAPPGPSAPLMWGQVRAGDHLDGWHVVSIEWTPPGRSGVAVLTRNGFTTDVCVSPSWPARPPRAGSGPPRGPGPSAS